MARVAVIKEAIMLCGKAGITPFLWGHRGMGKSSIIKQLAAQNNMGMVDFRCSQIEASDLRGLPDRADGRTIFLPPAEMPVGDYTNEQVLEALLTPFLAADSHFSAHFKGLNHSEWHDALLKLITTDIHARRLYEKNLKLLQPHFEKGIIFLDELNRAQDDVQQAAFQFVLDREVGQYVLPPGWIVVVAGNYNEGYQVSGFSDPAFLDRFCHLIFSGGDTTLEDWIYYMTNVHGPDAASVIEYASQNVKHLDGEVAGELGFSIQPSRRSWESVVKVDKCAKEFGVSEEVKTEVVAGLVGRDLAIAYSKYNCPVKPKDLLTQGVKPHIPTLRGLSRNQLTGLMWGLVSSTKAKITENAVSAVCLDFAEWMVGHQKDKDLVVAFCRALVTTGAGSEQERARAAVISNPRLAQMIGKFNKTSKGELTFIDKLCERPQLQAVLAQVSWGADAPIETKKK